MYGAINRVIIKPDIIKGGNMNLQLNHLYMKQTVKIVKITEKVEEGIHWTFFYIQKIADKSGVIYLWWKVSDKTKIQYLIDI